MATIPITVLTPNAAQQSLQNNGLAALGLTTVSLSRRWADATPAAGDYNNTQLTLALNVNVRAPFLGIRENGFRDASSTLAADLTADAISLSLAAGEGANFPSPVNPGRVLITLSNSSGSKLEVVECTQRAGDTLTIVRGALGTAKQAFSSGDRVILRLTPAQRSNEFYDATGAPINVNCTIFRLHPQAYARLLTICTARYGQGGVLTLPLPAAMVIHNAEGFRAPRWYRPDEVLDGVTGVETFHETRGFIVDPIYVAALFRDLQDPAALPGLVPAAAGGAMNGPGGVQSVRDVAGAQAATLVHFIDPHGNPLRIASPGASLITTDAGGVKTGDVNTPVINLAAGNRIATNAANSPLRIGFATNGTMNAGPLTPPNPAGGLTKLFYRVMAVDTPWYLRGNRTNGVVLGVTGDDAAIPADLLPAVRDQVDIDYLVDGPDTLSECTRVLNRANQQMIVAVSPNIDQTMLTPAQLGPNAHWPAFPPVNTNAGFPAPPIRLSPANVTAAYTAGNDVVVTVAAAATPAGAHVRIFPQQFVEIVSINGQEPSFVRGDGGANVADGVNPTQILLRNPFNLGANAVKPGVLTMDIVVAPRVGRRRLTGAVSVNVAAGPVAAPPDPPLAPAGVSIMAAMPVTSQGIAPSPLFGVPATVAPPANQPTDLVGLAVSLMAEPSPRQAGRLPTMARHEPVVTTGTTGAVQPAGTLLWEAVLSGARWAKESRSAEHESGNPGNPAGPDVHAPGIFTTGALAYDLSLHAMRRAKSIIPMPTTNAGVDMGWVTFTGGDNFNLPSDAANTGNTGTGVLLESIAVGCETPWLSLLSTPPPGNTVNQMIQDAASAMGVTPPAINITIANEPRIQREVRREFFAAKKGYRDAQWALRRAFAEARELVYIESPQFARTARPADAANPASFEVDLVAELAARLTNHSSLRVIVCTPRFSDYDEKFKHFARQHYQARMEALGMLQSAAKDRVLLFHPIGFPGRTAFIRTTSVIVDDVWCLVGATHFRRRGMTFDGSCAIASFDRQITNGYSTKVRNYRRLLMAAKLKVPVPAAGQPLNGEFVRLGQPASAFDVIHDLLAQGGFGRIQSVWPGPPDNSILPAQPDVADPDGSNGVTMFSTLAGMFNELGS